MRAIFALTFTLLMPLASSAQSLAVSFQPSTQTSDPTPKWAARVAFFDTEQVASQSAVGKTAAGTLDALRKKREAEASEKTKALQAEQQRLDSGTTLLSEAARAELAKKIERFQIDLQRFLEDARAELSATQQQVTEEFRRKLAPAVERVAKERGLDLIFSRAESGLFWASPNFDVSDDVAKQMDRTDVPE